MRSSSAVLGLIDRFGPEMRVVERIAAAAISGRGRPAPSVDDIVALTAIDYSTVREVLEGAEWSPELARELVAATPEYVDFTSDRWAQPKSDDPQLLAITKQMETLIGGVPSPKVELDHIQATPHTVAARALLLARSIDLAHASVLLLGDHDLTSLAITLLEPRCNVVVVDVDEDLLGYIADAASSPIRTLFADLRLGIPPALLGQMDVVLTDPPYSIPGMAVFVHRARAALRPSASSRMLLAYGYSFRALRPAHTIQHSLLKEDLLIEALIPHFNRYNGAPSIGMQADMTVARCVPTRRQWSSVSDDVETAIYSRGPSAVEAESGPATPTSREVEGASIRLKPVNESPSPSRLDRFLYDDRPPQLLSGKQTRLVAELDVGLAGLAFRIALAAPAVENVEIRCGAPIPPPTPGLRRILEARWSWQQETVNGERVLRFDARSRREGGLVYLASRGMTKLRRAAVEAAIRDEGSRGRTMTKREARESLSRCNRLEPLLDDAIIDLPDWALGEVADFVEREG